MINISKRKTYEQYVHEVKEINKNIEVLEEYKGAKTKILHRCLICDNKWYSQPSNILSGCGCPECAKKTIGLKNSKRSDDYKNQLYITNKNVELLGEYMGSHGRIKCKCKKCNHIWNPIADSLLRGHGCPCCSVENNSEKLRKTHDEYVKQLASINKNIEVIEKYKHAKEKIKHKCKICNHQWMITPSDALQNKSCPLCTISHGEDKIRRYLSNNKISFVPQKTYDDLKGIGNKCLSYDFYLPEYNLLIEFQGKQHKQPIEYFGGEEQFKIQQEHDKRKKEYAKLHKINLLEIWYYDIDNIEEILKQTINNLKSKSVETVIVV